MEKLLDDLWYSYIQCEDSVDSKEAKEVLKKLVEIEDKFISTLDEEQHEVFDSYCCLYSDLFCIYEKEAFVKGLKFATKYLLNTIE